MCCNLNIVIDKVLRGKYNNYDIISERIKPEEPEVAYFFNYQEGYNLLKHHIECGSNIAIHADVDLDGIGSAYILYKFLIKEMGLAPILFINDTKEHGIKESYNKEIVEQGINLVIVVDSSSNEIETLSKMDCDVLVLDHHLIGDVGLKGFTSKGEYVIINNVVDNISDGYKGDTKYSAGLLVYEYLRLYLSLEGRENYLFSSLLYQWAVVTLYSDVIPLDSYRVQYYIGQSLNCDDIEYNLKLMLNALNPYIRNISKRAIIITLAPYINKVIRGGGCREILSYVLKLPNLITDLDRDKYYSDKQKSALLSIKNCVRGDGYSYLDLTQENISPSYAGYIASSLVRESGNSAVVFTQVDGFFKGSFRGKLSLNYIDLFKSKCVDTREYVRGHKGAFGFKMTRDTLGRALKSLKIIEAGLGEEFIITAGDMPERYKGIYQIQGNIISKEIDMALLGLINSRLSSVEEIPIYVRNSNEIVQTKRYSKNNKEIYDIYYKGIQGIAFECLITDILKISVEMSDKLEVIFSNHINI